MNTHQITPFAFSLEASFVFAEESPSDDLRMAIDRDGMLWEVSYDPASMINSGWRPFAEELIDLALKAKVAQLRMIKRLQRRYKAGGYQNSRPDQGVA